jgi:hypothetical protein
VLEGPPATISTPYGDSLTLLIETATSEAIIKVPRGIIETNNCCMHDNTRHVLKLSLNMRRLLGGLRNI